MFLNNLSSLEIGLLAGGGAVLLAFIVVLVLLICRICGAKEKETLTSPKQKRRRRMTSAHQHSTIDLPPLLVMDSMTGSPPWSAIGMIDNPLCKSFPSEGESGTSSQLNDSPKSHCKSHESLAVPRSPREFMYYMRNLEQSRSQHGLNNISKEPQPSEVHNVKIFAPGYPVSESHGARDGAKKRENFPPKRKTSGALRNPAYRELMQGNSFHVVCTTPCTDTWSDDSESEPEIHEPKARIRFTSILEEQSGSTGSCLNVVSSTSLPPTYHETKARSLSVGQEHSVSVRL
ncbi:uncharacterized protein LOC116614378 [Nematostella vectensis]|uniref:uncharacterized protein LOC116614378 n=1 Tax=Nematostella vectensis TaxID=45351 RepID=UPI0013905C40|nr:uncharacterized protein LOC116614378 [Nematostella vectensis]XP_032231198.1 uncharacterized protein LOC116614378 [Nematostella vectensis]XP_032231200.1 uncharacterized protein LOC116614378 [Nematostella vectensis]XP_032231201.1 uncharacterized protein LOC116614378 [Nematostella vectensis]XP_048577000.1 uncharacterized protein LOC116614378 [Nematostella vectensis]